jgi:hypothetical protein
MVDFAFEPSSVEVQAGTTVTWTNDGQTPHTATADDGSFDSGNVAPGQSFSQAFEQPGTFDYHCEFHPQMTGAVVVQGEGGSQPTQPRVQRQRGGDGLPETGVDVGAFLYLAAALIATGAALLRLNRDKALGSK